MGRQSKQPQIFLFISLLLPPQSTEKSTYINNSRKSLVTPLSILLVLDYNCKKWNTLQSVVFGSISLPYCSTNIRGNWKIPCVWGLGFFHENLYLCRERGEPFKEPTKTLMCFPCGSVVKKLPANARDAGLIPGSGRSPGKGNGNPLQHSCLGNPMDRGSWWATVHGVTKELDTT